MSTSILHLLVAAALLCLLAPSFPHSDALTVHLVCHSHDDVGWQITVDEYYDREVRNIINTVLDALLENPARKFMYVEQAFFQRWWREANDTRRTAMQNVVKAGQMEFVNGGWAMHDEAGTHYVDMIDQTTLGHRYITQQFGVQPTVTWQIDPFGHSASQATLFGQLSGIDAVFFARIDYQDKNVREANKQLEMIWRSSPSLGTAAQTFAGAFANGYGYGAPSGFSWDSARNTQIQNNRSLPGYNLDTYVANFIQSAHRQAGMTQGENLMWTLGSDFNYQNAHTWYPNLDKLIEGVNANGTVKTLYSTPSIYLAAKYAEKLSWPLKTDDFFPYADGPDAYWTGYFTSRAALKRYVRFASAYLQVVRHFELYSAGDGSVSQPLWEAQGVAQHHDGVSGTAKQAVTLDYAQRISEGYQSADTWLGQTLGKMVTRSGTPPVFASCPLINQSVCATSQMGGSLVVILYNPTVHRRFERVTIPWPSPNAQVVDATAAVRPSQTAAVMPNLARGPDSAPYDVQFVAEVAGLGLNTYFIVSPSELQLKSTPHRHQRAAADSTEMRSFVPSPNSPDVSIENAVWVLNFDGTTGFLSSVTNKFTGATVALSQSFFWYASYQGSGQDSGAYIFRPDVSNATALPVAKAAVNVTTVVGALASEVRQSFTPWLTQIVRLTAGLPEIEFEWTVGHIPVGDAQGKEIISRFSSNISSNATWYTDSNGREFVKRVRNFRPTWSWQPTEITAGNYYPCNAMAWLADESAGPGRHGMAVLTDRSQGCSSQQDGALEFMVHRRLLHDDGRGVGEPLNEPGTDGLGLTVTGLHYLLLAPPAELAFVARQTAGRVFAPVQPMIARLSGSVSDYISSHLVTSSLLKTAVPPSIELMTLQVSNAGQENVLLRLSHQYGVGESDMWSRSVTLDLSQLFTVAISSATELSLTGNQAAGTHKQLSWNTQTRNSPVTQVKGLNLNQQAGFNVTISPAQIRTFNITFQDTLTWRM